jgi:AcrR family transcriptional regulator
VGATISTGTVSGLTEVAYGINVNMYSHQATPMGTQKQQTEIRREQIARAALSLIASQGVSGLSIAAVARRVGLVPSAIYRHFKSKGAVLDAVIDHVEGRLLTNVDAATGEAADALESLQRLLARHVRMIRENEGIPRLVFSEDTYAACPGRKAKVFAMIRRYLTAVAGIVERGQNEGRIRPEFPAPTVALMFLGLIQPAAILWHMSEGNFDVTREVDRAWSIFSETIRCT